MLDPTDTSDTQDTTEEEAFPPQGLARLWCSVLGVCALCLLPGLAFEMFFRSNSSPPPAA